jgi:predicted ATPase/DNA-binding winged helix-turn-helix (wHTH) protein
MKVKSEKSREIAFDAFRLDSANQCLWQGSNRVYLRPKTFAVLRYLVEHPGRLIAKDELLGGVWTDSHVCDEVLKNSIFEIRKALRDSVKRSRLIQTEHSRGYRFVGEITELWIENGGNGKEKLEAVAGDPQLVRRESELAQLKRLMEKAQEGIRQVVFVTGEQGIGKTSLVDKFLETLNPRSTDTLPGPAYVARGQCLEFHGAIEAYMPILEALTALCRQPGRMHVQATLRRYAPQWLMQMPSLLNASQFQELRRVTVGAMRERMLREMAETLEVLSSDIPLVLVLEDLHWSDPSTLHLISYLGQRRAPARLLLICTYRASELGDDHLLRAVNQELQMHHQCQELPLALLDSEAMRKFLAGRFPDHRFPQEIEPWIHERTEGNPLFMVNFLEHLLRQGVIVHEGGYWILKIDPDKVDLGVPATIQDMVELELGHRSPAEQSLLEAGSIEGIEFSTEAVAAVLDEDPDRINALCKGLARRHQFVQPVCMIEESGERFISQYRFIHSLYQRVCYQQLSQTRKAELHRRMGEYIEEHHRNDVEIMAAKLTTHLEYGKVYHPATRYYARTRLAGMRDMKP